MVPGCDRRMDRQTDGQNYHSTNAPFVGNQTAKFQLNLPLHTTATATMAFVRSPQNTSVSSLCG